MDVQFNNTKLEQLYCKGSSRKYRVEEQVRKKFFMRVQQLEAAETIHDLQKCTSLHFEKLQGQNTYSVRVDKQWRLEFTVDWKDEAKTCGDIWITELSNHFGD